MLLRKLVLKDFGLYKGEHVFDLSPREVDGVHKPIILFGGKNGAGKTTLFDSIRFVLYGRSSLGARVTKSEYLDYLRGKVHRSSLNTLQNNTASVSLEFDYVSVGEEQRYVVSRSWEIKGGKNVIEYLSIKKDGEELSGVTDEYWQGFVESIVPERLSTLFFFDGEKKIKDIAEDDGNNNGLADSIRSLLGLDVVSRLGADLDVYRLRHFQNRPDFDYESKFGQYDEQIEELEFERERLVETIGELNKDIDLLSSAVRRKEEDLQSEGHVFAQQRERLIERKLELSAEIDGLLASFRDECTGVYPLALCPNLLGALVDRVQSEKKYARCKAVASELKQVEDALQEALSGLCLDGGTRADVSKLVAATFSRHELGEEFEDGFEPILELSDQEAERVLARADEALTVSAPKVKKLFAQIDTANSELYKVAAEIEKAPSDAVVRPIMADIANLSKKIALKEQELGRGNMRAKSIANELSAIERKKNSLLKAQEAEDEEKVRLELVGKVQKALGDYSERMTQAKVEQLRELVAGCFNSLSRKGDLLKKIEIDPLSFAVTLYDRYGNCLPKDELSSGEKQMYAVAMLWGLAIASGRSLPVIIDTPLGRLDSDHRRSLIKNYFPKASSQVIILSTDTEVDKEWYSELSPYISHCYHMQYDPVENITKTSADYFWSVE